MKDDPNRELEDDPGQRRFRILLLALSLLCLLTVGYLVHRESGTDAPYRRHQRRFQELSSLPVTPGVRQISVGDRVDRCPTCHLMSGTGIATGKKLRQLDNPYRQHPGKLLTWHRPDRFACTSCHAAGGAYLDRCLPATGDRDGRALNRWRVQASCRWCHAEAEHLPGAPILTRGIQAYRRLGCGGCHKARGLDPATKIGPPLNGASIKLSPQYVRAFLEDPQRIRPGTAMPSFFSTEVMRGAPPFTIRKKRQLRADMIRSLAAFVLSLPPTARMPRMREKGDKEASATARPGGALFVDLGCIACHVATPQHEKYLRAGLGGVGPDLRVSRGQRPRRWLSWWLGSPRSWSPGTRMPDLRLTADERLSLVAYLKPRADARASHPSKVHAEQGQAIARSLGCAGCHAIAPLAATPLVGPDLDGFGDKPLDLLDWGHHHATDEKERDTFSWTEIKLSQPLAFDRRPGVLLMPWQRLRSGELRGLLVLMRSLVEEERVPLKRVASSPLRSSRLQRGERVVQHLACRRCHQLGERADERGRDAPIKAVFALPSDRPPSLDGEGDKVQPAWLHRFLAQPTPLRPWLKPRMPTFNLDRRQLDELAAYFAARDRTSYPFTDQRVPELEGARLKEALALFDRLKCIRCHLLSNAPKLKPGELSPDLALSGARLRREWIRCFLLAPQQAIPGTKMPTLFPLLDEDDPKSRTTPEPTFFVGDVNKQIEALTDLSLWWGSPAAAVHTELRGKR